MRTTLVIKDDLLDEAMALSGTRTKRETVERALKEPILRRRSKKLLDLEGKVDLALTPRELLRRRKRDALSIVRPG